MRAPVLSIPREAGISFAINATLSLVFFLGVFGLGRRALSGTMPDALAFDFVPQSIAVSLMSALVPALIVRKRLAMAIGLRSIVLRAIAFALAGAALGGLIAFLIGSAGFSPVDWHVALAMKLTYGGSLGALITSLTLQRMTR
ncbi:hypothetical protein D0Z70_03610 [Sphingobium terrigena]|uniref:Uncharacterized protein n=1 Tax=Sphingobium terrigena TaxID=2304063 RepID=A0A418YXI4_9SPHN|nr:hypothetical protein [Sphingobium terrigena]RJG57302.1 hypothetical protein D0Z70_03610 [Sphingobium terrigena]